MGVLMLTDFQADLTTALQRGNVPVANLTRWINQAMKEFAYAFRFHELEFSTNIVTAQGQYQYSISDPATRWIEELTKFGTAAYPADTGQGRLGRIIPETRSDWLKNIGDLTDATQQGEPLYYHRYGEEIILRPIPDSIGVYINVDYYKNVPNLVASTDTSPFKEDWDEAIFLGALYRGLRSYREPDYISIRNDFLAFVRSRATEFEMEEFPEGGISPATGHSDGILSTGSNGMSRSDNDGPEGYNS
jgi:hypothetical protein